MNEKLLAVLAILFLSIFAMPPKAASTQQTRLYVDPPEIIDQGLVPNSTFTIAVKIENVPEDPGVVGIEFKLYWDASLLEGVSMVLPPDHFLTPDGDVGNLWNLAHTVGSGSVYYAYSFLNINKEYLPKSGNGTIATIELKVKSVGSCILDLKNTIIGTPAGEELSHDAVDGYFENSPPAPPPPPAKLYVNPPKIVDPTLIPSENFAINISIANATDVYSFEFKLGFDPNVLNVTNVELGDFFPSSVTPLEETNNTAGYVWFSATLLLPEPPKSGNGTLAIFTFHVRDLGASVLPLYDTRLADQTAEPLSHSTADGHFSNILMAKLYVDPPEIIDPTLLPSSTFTINITIDDVEDLRICEFNLTYNTNIVSWVSLTVNEVLGETPSAKAFGDDEAGFIWIKLTYSAPKTTYYPIALVTMLFHVDALGSTPLDLHDTKLTDPLDQPIPHEAFDGFFLSVIRDVAVVNVVPSPNDVYKGRIVDINVTVINEGDVAETFDVKAYYDDTLIETITVTNLPSKENTTVTLNWNTAGVEGSHNYTVRAEAVPVTFETDLLDNAFTDGSVRIRILGDVNADGTVDILDVVLSTDAFGSYLGHPRWNPWADMNDDGDVDILDMILLASNFGKAG